jgi:hypothetical protein
MPWNMAVESEAVLEADGDDPLAEDAVAVRK